MTKIETTFAISIMLLAGNLTSCSVIAKADRATDRSGYVRVRPSTESDKIRHAATQAGQNARTATGATLTPSVTDRYGEDIPSVTLGEVEVVAKTRVVAEREGMVSMPFIITVPADYCDRDCRVTVTPVMHSDGTHKRLDPLVITGEEYRRMEARDRKLGLRHHHREGHAALMAHVRDSRYFPYKYRDSLDVKAARAAFLVWEEETAHAHWRADTVLPKGQALRYYYRQEMPAEDVAKRVTLTYSVRYEDLSGGHVTIPGQDTLQFVVTTMADFLDRSPRYVERDGVETRDTDYDEALRQMDEHHYKLAFAKMTERRDLNAAVCYLAMGYSARAVNILVTEEQGALRDYLLAVGYLRLGMDDNAAGALRAACRSEKSLREKAEMDPELGPFIRRRGLEKELYKE